MKQKIGIFFGGPSREREISFMGGRTVYNHIDKRYFEPVLIFVDSIGNFIKVDPEIFEYSEIRSFYPSKNQNRGFKIYIESLGKLSSSQLYKLIYKIGSQVKIEELKELIDFAFIIMHGQYAEDGSLQGLMEWLNIPYLGSGLLTSSIGINKPFHDNLIAQSTGFTKKSTIISKKEWDKADKSQLFTEIISKIGFPFVVKAPHQGSSIGVSIVKKRSLEEFTRSVQQCFFETKITKLDWDKHTNRRKRNLAERLSRLDEGLGFPLILEDQVIYHPADLVKALNNYLKENAEAVLTSVNSEDYVMIEQFIKGIEFSCGVLEDEFGNIIPLPPAEVYGEIETFDFKSKYISTESKKRIPVKTSSENLDKIHEKIISAARSVQLGVFNRIDGFITEEDDVVLFDPNTIPGMAPTSFIFKQLAEVGLNITDSITFLVRQSLIERKKSGKNQFVLDTMLKQLSQNMKTAKPRKKLAIIFGENAEEYEVAKKVYGEFGGHENYNPIAVCHALNGSKYIIPVNLMFKPDINEFGAAIGQKTHPFIEKCKQKAKGLRELYAGEVDFNVKKIEDQEFAQLFEASYDCKTNKLESV